MQILERRKQRRLPLHWPVRVSGEQLATSKTKTENLSARGFYCLLENSPAPGTILDCNLTVPNYGPTDSVATRSVVCHAEIVRVEARGTEPGFGVGFRILDFRIAKNGGDPLRGNESVTRRRQSGGEIPRKAQP